MLYLQSCNGDGCRSRTFEPQRSTAVAVDFQKLRLQARSPPLSHRTSLAVAQLRVLPCLTRLEASCRLINQNKSAS